MGTISLPLEPPVVVLGDASYSMDVAIRTATIIASLLSFLADAELKFFNDQLFDPPLVPRTIEEVLRVRQPSAWVLGAGLCFFLRGTGWKRGLGSHS